MRRIPATLGCVLLSALAGEAGAQSNPENLTTPADLSRIAGWKGAAVNDADAFRFVVMSDRTGEHVPGVWARAVAQINLLRPDFVMCIGDLVEGFEKTRAGALAEWKELDGMVRRLEAPFFYCPGNHDVPNGHYRAVYVRRPGVKARLWHSFNYRRCHFVIFDSTAMEREIPGIAEPQWEWLKKDLASAAGARHVFVFEHHPVFGDKGDWMRLRKMLHAGKTTIFCGHEHSLSFAVESGIDVLMLGPTGGFNGGGDWKRGRSHQFAHVTVSGGKPRICIVPVGNVLPHDLRSGRGAAARRRAVAWGAEFTPVTRAGGEVTFTLPNASDVKATYTLKLAGPAAWFAGRRPAPETLALGPGKSARRTYRLARPGSATAAPPAVEIAYEFAAAGQTVRGKHRADLFARAVLAAGRAGAIAVDGRLDDWAAVPPRPLGASWQVGDAREEWTGPADCSATTRIAYDDENLYVAVDVTDDTLVCEGARWHRDGVEFLWDPRPADNAVSMFTGPCRQVAVALPGEGEKVDLAVSPAGAKPAPRVRAACRRRKGGYAVELAIAVSSIAEGFRIAPGGRLRVEFLLNDKDAPGDKAPLSCLTTTGYVKPNYRTHRYAELTFK